MRSIGHSFCFVDNLCKRYAVEYIYFSKKLMLMFTKSHCDSTDPRLCFDCIFGFCGLDCQPVINQDDLHLHQTPQGGTYCLLFLPFFPFSFLIFSLSIYPLYICPYHYNHEH